MPDDTIRPFIRVNTKHDKFSINRATHDVLGRPPYLEFLWNEEKKLFVIVPIFVMKTGAFTISPKVLENRHYEISVWDTMFFDRLINKLGWKRDTVYKVYGEYMPSLGAVSFQMADPVISGGVVK